ncbi:MAG: cytochrome c-type biosis protein [Bacteroidota bacterium]|nr:cytochrome c-type biosis protein [Bacteroidota bacterium]
MIDSIFNYLSEGLYYSFWLALASSFGWGILSILLSPCHLSSIPLVVGFINSQKRITTGGSFKLSLVFSIGILITISVIGIITALAGRLIGDIGSVGNYLVAAVFFIVGLYFFDIIDLSFLGLSIKGTKYQGWIAALILGLLFGIGLGPCAFAFMAPVLSIVFGTAQTDLIYAISLLSAFALGHCSVLVAAGTASSKLQKYLDWSNNSRSIKIFRRICGILIIAGGIYMIYNAIS